MFMEPETHSKPLIQKAEGMYWVHEGPGKVYGPFYFHWTARLFRWFIA